MKAPSWPHSADLAFAIRDDDVSYFTSVEMLKKIYSAAWNRGYKVSFAVIPMHRTTNNMNVPPQFRDSIKCFSIHQNKELVEYLNSKMSKGTVDIVQHGFCHTERSGLPTLTLDLEAGGLYSSNGQDIDLAKFSEFYGLTEKECRRKIQKGRELLKQDFGKIKAFVAPQEYLSKNLWESLKREGLYYCGGSNIHAVPIRSIIWSAIFRNVFRRFQGKRVYPQRICDISGLPHLIPSYKHYWNKYRNDALSTYWFERFKKEFQECLRQRGAFILVTHYWEYFYDWKNEVTQSRQLEYFNKIFDYVDKYNVWKCTLTELFEWIFENKTA